MHMHAHIHKSTNAVCRTSMAVVFVGILLNKYKVLFEIAVPYLGLKTQGQWESEAVYLVTFGSNFNQTLYVSLVQWFKYFSLNEIYFVGCPI